MPSQIIQAYFNNKAIPKEQRTQVYNDLNAGKVDEATLEATLKKTVFAQSPIVAQTLGTAGKAMDANASGALEGITSYSDLSSTERNYSDIYQRRGMSSKDANLKIGELREDRGVPKIEGVMERAATGFTEGIGEAEDKLVRRVGQRAEEEKQMEGMGLQDKFFTKLSNLGKEVGTGINVVTQPFVSAIEDVLSPIVQPVAEGTAKQMIPVWTAIYGKDVADETKNLALEKMGNLFQAYEGLPDDKKEVIDNAFRFGDLATMFTGGKIATEGAEVGAKQVAKTGAKVIEEIAPLAEDAVKMFDDTFGKMKIASGARASRDAEKLATEILQPSNKDVKLAKLAGDSTSDGVKEYVKVAETAKDFDDALSKLAKQTSDDFNKRNTILAKNNFTIDQTKPLMELEKHIADIRAKKLAPESKIKAMEEVLETERAWLKENKPDRLAAQLRKEDIYTEAKPLFKKEDAGTLLGNEEGRIKAYEILGRGYKDVVENGDKLVREMNASYGGKLSAMEMLASRGALAEKAISQTMLQKLAAPVVNLISSSTGAGSAQFVARLAASQETKLPKLIKRLIKLRDKAGVSKAEISQGDLDDIIKLLPAPKEGSPTFTGGKQINLPSKSQSTIDVQDMATAKPKPIPKTKPKVKEGVDIDEVLTKSEKSLPTQKKMLKEMEKTYMELIKDKNATPNMIEKARMKAYKQRQVVEKLASGDAKIPTSLIKEAQKYKSADEFMKAKQPKEIQDLFGELYGDLPLKKAKEKAADIWNKANK